MKNKKNLESHADFYPDNVLAINGKKIFSTNKRNSDFLKLLNELLKENYIKVEERSEKEYNDKIEREKRNRIAYLVKNIKENEYENFEYVEDLSINEKLELWKIKCEKLNCKVEYFTDRYERPIFWKNIVLKNKNEKEKIVKSILKGMLEPTRTDYKKGISSENYFELSNEERIYTETINNEFYLVLENLLGEEYKKLKM